MRQTKIVCTIGPSSSNAKVLRRMIRAGMDAARLNFSHGSHEDHARAFHLIRDAAEDMGLPIAIIQDLQGPKIRAGKFKGGSVHLDPDSRVTITTEQVLGTGKRFSTTYPELPKLLRKGNSILLDDGLLQLEVEEIRGGEVHCRVLKGGFLSDGKGMNIPDSTSRNVGLSDKDRVDLAFGLGLGVDYVAVSFVTRAAEVEEVRDIIRKYGARTGVIAKIEKPGAIEHLDDIVEAADGLMIARGDLGVEIPLEDLPGVQKRIISTCRRYGKPVITATQMLQSMVENRIPTRAEVLDIANAVDDGTDALMLSAETASGKHPVEAIEYMARIASKVEKESPRQDDREQDICGQWQISNAVGRAACELGEGLGAKAILAFTMSGSTARLISKHRRPTPVFAATADEAVMRQMSLYWGVRPVFMEMVPTTEKMFSKVEKTLLELELVSKDDLVVITAGVPLSMTGRTNLIKVHRVGSGHWN